ncbi:MAG: ATP-binding protein [Turicibacter sp.]
MGISLIIILVFTASIMINLFFVNRYYSYEQRKVLSTVGEQLEILVAKNQINELDALAQAHSVIIVYTDATKEISTINGNLIYEFEKNRIKLNKFWLTEETLHTLDERSVNKTYDQGISQFKVMTKFIKIKNQLFAIGLPLPYMKETIKIINQFNVLIMGVAICLIVLLVAILSRKITKPLHRLQNLSQDIANLNFRTEHIHTNDEIEDLSISINTMSRSLAIAHHEINTQNSQLKELMANISHELKTPLALIKAYEQGIEDGLDDGTFRETIYEQVDAMEQLIEKLLYWSKIENTTLNPTCFNLQATVQEACRKYALILKENNIDFHFEFDLNTSYLITGDEQSITVVLDNLFTNAIKYTNDLEITVSLIYEGDHVTLMISNGVNSITDEELEKIWNPFYVLEKSRSKELSGTGLGLPIVKSILEKHHYLYGITYKDNKITFFVTFV